MRLRPRTIRPEKKQDEGDPSLLDDLHVGREEPRLDMNEEDEDGN